MSNQNTTSSPAPVSPASPRSLRRSLVIGGVAVVAVVAGVGAAVSQTGWGPGFGHHRFGGGMMDPAAMGERIDWGVDRFLGRVDATPEQKQKVATILKDAARDLSPLRDMRRTVREDAARIMKAEKIDRAEIERLRSSQIAQMDTASKRVAQALGDIGDTLNAKQRAELVGRLEGFAFGRGMGGGMGGGMGHGMGRGMGR